MKNVDQGDSNSIPQTHSNHITGHPNSKEEGIQEPTKFNNDSKTSNLGDEKEKQKSNIASDKSSISHPKVIDILDNQLEQL